MDWTAMRDWLTESVSGMPRGAVLDLGPAGHDATDHDQAPVEPDAVGEPDAVAGADPGDDVPCAQIMVLRDGSLLVRLSTTLMEIPSVAGYVVPRGLLDRWNYEDRFRDCTHGYMVTRSVDCAADVCITWFRDRRGIVSPGELGCTYTVTTWLPRAS
ncbi:hypothetical protein GYA93_07710 [Gordonia desulfuricans]|uniref:Uncharacterized protein n=1 Tax=Gordonia desulfuricans TaxID=89051 RepID=A0A7K3LMK7_9ACTN|nr:hypothetical protein [Gordonia desulfuricans]